jgi:hypothetical protein
MIASFFDWCGRNIEAIIWFNIVLLIASAWEQALHENFYPMGLCAVMIAILYVLKK